MPIKVPVLYDRRLTRLGFALAYVAIVVLLVPVLYSSWSANNRADRAATAACRLVDIVDRQNRLLTSGVALLVAQPTDRADAMKALTDEIARQKAVAASAAHAAGCT